MSSTPKYYDRVQESSTTTGTGTYTLAGAVTGFQSFAVVGNGNSCFYSAFEVDGSGVPSGMWEVGIGTYTSSGTTLSRDAILASSNSGSAVSWSSGTRRIALVTPAGIADPSVTDFGGRLTLASGTAVPTTDQTAKTTLYYTPYLSNKIIASNGKSATRAVFSEVSIKSTDTQTGTTTNTGTTITGLTSTAQLVRGMKVSGTGVGTNAVISSIDSATQVTVSVASTASGSVSITFKLPASTIYDVFNVNGVLQLSNAWTNATTRADAIALDSAVGLTVNTSAINGSDTNGIAAKTGVWLGTIRTTGTDGQLEDSRGGASQSGGKRFVWNAYNQVPRTAAVIDTTDSWSYTTATWRQADGASGNCVEYVVGDPAAFLTVDVRATVYYQSNVTGNLKVSVGIDSTTTPNGLVSGTFQASGGVNPISSEAPILCLYRGNPGLGYHKLNWIEMGGGGTSTFLGDNAGDGIQSGMDVLMAG